MNRNEQKKKREKKMQVLAQTHRCSASGHNTCVSVCSDFASENGKVLQTDWLLILDALEYLLPLLERESVLERLSSAVLG